MRSYKACERLGLPVAAVVYERREGTVATRPVIVRDEIEVIIERCLRLLVYNPKYLINCSTPCMWKFEGDRIVWSTELETYNWYS